MENFERVGRSPFGPEGKTQERNIRFRNSSYLYIYEGGDYDSFRLRFGREDGGGWNVNPNSLDQLIAELLYIRRDIKAFRSVGGVREDMRIGRDRWVIEEAFAPAALSHSDDEVDEEEEEEDIAPF